MAQVYFPFDSGQGANATEAMWTKMARHWLGTGVISALLNELQVYADSTGMQVKVKTGAAWVKGHYYESDVEELLAIGNASSTNPRIDRIIIRLDWTANTIQLAVLQGTPAVSPSAPDITQNTSRWEISLAQILVGANVFTIPAGNVTDERKYAQNQSVVIANSEGGQNQASDVVVKLGVLTSEVLDRQSEWANNTFTAKEAGVYNVRAFVDWASTVPTNSSVIYVYKNGGNYNPALNVEGANSRYNIGSCMVSLSAGDTLEIYTLQSSGGTQKTLASARIEIAKIL